MILGCKIFHFAKFVQILPNFRPNFSNFCPNFASRKFSKGYGCIPSTYCTGSDIAFALLLSQNYSFIVD